MSDLTHIEKLKLERVLEMNGGGVLGFSNRTLETFFRDVVAVEIYDDVYKDATGSKAHRMRAFWRIGSNDEVVKLLEGLAEGWDLYLTSQSSKTGHTLLSQIAARLRGGIANAAKSQADIHCVADAALASHLHTRLMSISTGDPQRRGYDFEKFLKELFEAYGLTPRGAFRLTGEQIDGSFDFQNDTYLLEARWRGAPAAASHLRDFEGKVSEKAHWSRGLFISQSGFSIDGLESFGRGKRTVCMDGFDLSEMLRKKLSFRDVLGAKVRRAAETGSPFVTVRDLFGT